MILLWGLKTDAPMEMVRCELEKAGADYFFLDHRKIFGSQIDYEWVADGKAICTINIEGQTIDLNMVTAAYIRPHNFFEYSQMKGKGASDPMAVQASAFEEQLMAWLNVSDITLINRAGPCASNNSKNYQLSLIKKAGFAIPQTFISDEMEMAELFLHRTPRAVYRPINGVRSIPNDAGREQMQDINDVQWRPTLFQKVAEGVNYRVHVVGDEVFAARIISDRLDYRYGNTIMTTEDLPGHVVEKCLLLNKLMGLHFSGIELMRTPDNEWYCFEVNPSPGFSYFEYLSGAPISAAVARFMMKSDRPSFKISQLIAAAN